MAKGGGLSIDPDSTRFFITNKPTFMMNSYVEPNNTRFKHDIMDITSNNPILNDHEDHVSPASSKWKPVVNEMDFFAADKNNSSKETDHRVINVKKEREHDVVNVSLCKVYIYVCDFTLFTTFFYMSQELLLLLFFLD